MLGGMVRVRKAELKGRGATASPNVWPLGRGKSSLATGPRAVEVNHAASPINVSCCCRVVILTAK